MAGKNSYDVILEKVGNQQLKTTKALCSALGLGLAAAKGMVDKAPTTVAKGLDKEKALALKKELEALGNTASIPGMEIKASAPATTKKATGTKRPTTKKSAPSSSKAATPSNDDFDAIFGGDTTQKTTTLSKSKSVTKPKSKAPASKSAASNDDFDEIFGNSTQKTETKVQEKAPKVKIERVEFDNGDVYEGEMVDGLRHGKGKYTWANGDFYEGEWAKGWRSGFGIYKSYSKNEVDGSTFASYVYEGDWKNSKKHGHGVATGYKAVTPTGRICSDWSYDGEWIEDNRHGNGKYTYADGSYFTGVWENNKKISASETISPAGTEDCIEEVYEQDVDTADDGFETMTDYYTACMDATSELVFNFDAQTTHDLISLDSAVEHIVPFFNQVLFCFEENEPDSATEFLAEIVQVDANTLYETFSEDGMFDKDSIDIFDVCASALKCAFLNYIEYPNENTYIATLHFAYFLYKTYSELNGNKCSGLLAYYLSLYIAYGIPQNDQAKDLGALFLARLYEYDTEYVKLDEDSKFYKLEERYGELFTKYFDESEKGLAVNLNGALIDEEAGIVFHRLDDSFVVKSGFGDYELEDGGGFVGYVGGDGKPYGWGAKFGTDGSITKGFWKNGQLNGFAMYLSGHIVCAGNYENGYLNGLGFRYNMLCDLDYPIESVYFKDGEGVSNPDFGPDQSGHQGRYSNTMQYFGNLDSAEYAHGWCCLWTDDGDPQYYAEGIYDHGRLDHGFRAWLRECESVEWAYGSYIRNKEKNGYLLNTTPAFPEGQKGRFSIKDGHISLEFYDRGEFKNNYLNGKGTRVFPDGRSISGYFINGGLARIERVVLPDGTESNPANHTNFLSTKQSADIVWEKLSNMSTEEKNAFFAESPILVVPTGVKKIPEYMFYKCENLQGVYFNEELEEIGKNAFAWCKNLGPVLEIPQSVYRIAESAFSVCNSIRTIYLPNNITVAKWGFMCGVHNVFFETDPPRGVALDNGAFSDSDMVMSKDMIKKIKAINRRAFK